MAELPPKKPVPLSSNIAQTTSPFTGKTSQLFVPPALAKALEPAPLLPLPQHLRADPMEQLARRTPHQIMQVEHFLDADTCSYLCDYIERAYQRNSTMPNHARTAYAAVHDAHIKPMLREIFYRAFTRVVQPFFGVQVEWWEAPQLLRYAPGGKYDAHSDSERYDTKLDAWVRENDRDISIILYLSDEFTGGLLHFPHYDLKIRPKPGLLVAFPSHQGYKHGAEPTEEGLRYVIATWSSLVGVPKLKEPHRGTVFMNEFRNESDV